MTTNPTQAPARKIKSPVRELFSDKLMCTADELGYVLSTNTNFSVKAVDTLLDVLDLTLGTDELMLIAGEYNESDSWRPTHTIPVIIDGVKFSALMEQWMTDGKDVHTAIAHVSQVPRASVVKVMEVVTHWLGRYELKSSTKGVAPFPPTDAHGNFGQPVIFDFVADNLFESDIISEMGKLLVAVRVKSQQPSSVNAPLRTTAYKRDALVECAINKRNKVLHADDTVKVMQAMSDFIGYLLMILRIARDAETRAPHELHEEWSIQSIMHEVMCHNDNAVVADLTAINQKQADEINMLKHKLHELTTGSGMMCALSSREFMIGGVPLDEYIVPDNVREQIQEHASEHLEASATKFDGVRSNVTVKTDANGIAQGHGIELPELKLPSSSTRTDDHSKHKEVYAFYGAVTININGGK